LPEETKEKIAASLDAYKILDFDKNSARKFSETRSVLEKEGKMIPIFDLVTASIALVHGAMVVTGDSHYERIPGLKAKIMREQD